MIPININISTIAIMWIYMYLLNLSWRNSINAEPALQEYCMLESFQPLCPRNEVVLMKSATYGRMRIGRCITSEEVDAFRVVAGDDPRYLGCYADVLNILDRKCSGKAGCDTRSSDISSENIKPCHPGLTVYLEVSYECISVVDGGRSCSVTISKTPAYILSESVNQGECGTKSQPWVLEAPIGQKINTSVFDFTTSNSDSHPERSKQQCRSHGLIIDKSGKGNVSLCVTGESRQRMLYLSAANVVHVVFESSTRQQKSDDGVQFMLKVEAVGCAEIVPPDDAWLKRNDDAIVIGCYSSRQTWRLSCNGGSWIGVLGNCSKDNDGHSGRDINPEFESESIVMNDKQVITIVAIGGFTLTICLVIVCSGAVYLKRFYVQFQKKQEYKTLTFHRNSASVQRMTADPSTLNAANDADVAFTQQIPTYPVYAGQSGSMNVDDELRADIKHQQM